MTVTTFEPGTTYHLPPAELLLERNIRNAQADAGLVDSIRELGVLEPITAVVADDGRLLVRFGHRRTLAAIAAERATVPVYVSGTDATTNDAEIDRIVRQLDENTQREGVTAGDRVGAYEQLAAFGLPAGDIAKRTRTDQATVDTALVVAGSKVARKTAEKYSELTLEQAAVVAEFEDDKNTVQALAVAAIKQPHQFAHVAQQARDERARNAQRAQLIAELDAAGVTLLDNAPEYESKVKPLHRLRDKGKDLTETRHRKCPGHVAWLSLTWVHVDDDTSTNRRQVQQYRPSYGCSDFKKHGHTDTWSMSNGTKTAAADMDPAEREKARKQRQLIVDNNKAWDSATTVRRAWLTELAQRKTAPKGAAAFLARAVVEDLQTLTDYRSHGILAELHDHTAGPLTVALTKHMDKASEGRQLLVGLTAALAGYEAVSTRDSWRQNGTTSPTGRYLRFLESCGYGLSDVEKYAVSSKTALS